MLDTFQSSLSPSMAEALICSQDWLRHNKGQLIIEESLEEIEKIEEGITFSLFYFLHFLDLTSTINNMF